MNWDNGEFQYIGANSKITLIVNDNNYTAMSELIIDKNAVSYYGYFF